MKKRILCAMLSVLLLFLCCFPAGASQAPTVLSNAAETSAFVMVSRDFTTPIRLVPAKLTQDGETTDVWLVALLGVKPVRGQVNMVLNTIPAMLGRTNSYYRLVKSVLQENVPEGAKLVFACHSLGGIVAQKLRTDCELKEKYEILNVVTAGSPYIMVLESLAEGELHRLADIGDAVPFLSPATLVCLTKQLCTAHWENGGYLGNPSGAHNVSYKRADVWGGYDALGVPGGDAALSFNASAVLSFGVQGE